MDEYLHFSFPIVSTIRANNLSVTEQERIQGALYSLQALTSGFGLVPYFYLRLFVSISVSGPSRVPISDGGTSSFILRCEYPVSTSVMIPHFFDVWLRMCHLSQLQETPPRTSALSIVATIPSTLSLSLSTINPVYLQRVPSKENDLLS